MTIGHVVRLSGPIGDRDKHTEYVRNLRHRKYRPFRTD